MSDRRRIFLIRHGETPGNAARVFQVPETPLSRRGRGQALALGRRLRRESIEHVVASDYRRAAETASAVARATGAPLRLEPLLRERNFGDLRGTPYSALRHDPFREDYVPPNGESWPVFHERVERAWQVVAALAEEARGDLAVVTHGLVCRAILERSLAAGERLRDAGTGGLAFANTSVTITGARPPWPIERIGCIEHLAELERPSTNGAPA